MAETHTTDCTHSLPVGHSITPPRPQSACANPVKVVYADSPETSSCQQCLDRTSRQGIDESLDVALDLFGG